MNADKNQTGDRLGISVYQRASAVDTRLLVLLLLVAAQVGLLIVAKRPMMYLLTIGGLAAFVYLLSGQAIEKLLLLTVVVACLQSIEAWNARFRLVAVLPALAAFLLWVNSITRRTGMEPQVNTSERQPGYRPKGEIGANRCESVDHVRGLSRLEILILILVATAVVQAISGISQQYNAFEVWSELIYYLYFLVAIVVIRANLSESGIRKLFVLIIALTLVICFSYLRVFIATAGTVRPANLQQHMLNLGIPLLAAFYLRESGMLRRFLYGLLLVIAAAATYVTLTRSLWLYVPLSLVLLVFLLVRHRHVVLPTRTIALTGLVILALIAMNQFQSQRRAASKGTALGERAQTLRTLGTDLSLIARYDLALQTIRQWSRHPILGCGLGGAVRYSIFTGDVNRFHHLDSSYLTVLWKLGLVGLLAFIAIYAVFLQRIWFVYRHARDEFQILVAAGTFTAFVSLVIIGIESGILAIYRFNLVWAILMGVFERWAQQLKEQ